MGTRPLLGLIVMVAVLFVSALIGSVAASAATMNHDVQMMENGHCAAPPSHHGDHDKSAGKNCCISMCMAVAIAPAAPPEAAVLHDAMTAFPVLNEYHGLLAEIATPPPRLA
jgi:hypothetical protein